MIVGPIFSRELVTAPRRPHLFLYRALYALAVLLLMGTAWLVVFGTQTVRGVGDLARFGAILFRVLAPLQLAWVVFFSALLTASAVGQEKDRRTLVLLLMTRLNNSELVLGRLLASLLNVLVMILAGLPVLMLLPLLGGVSFQQVGRVFVVTVVTALAAGSLGVLVGYWREKTFQTLALTALILVFWLGGWEAVASGIWGERLGGVTSRELAAVMSPLRAVVEAASPFVEPWGSAGWHPTAVFVVVWLVITGLLAGLAIVRLRVWNPSRQVLDKGLEGRAGAEGRATAGTWDDGEAGREERERLSAAAREGHVDAGVAYAGSPGSSREVWTNPVLWREVCTWAYGRKVVFIRLAYWLLWVVTILALRWLQAGVVETETLGLASLVSPAARPLLPLFLVSLVIINALAVSAITSERDTKSLDLLLVTDLSPAEFLFGKLAGVLWLAKDMIVLPLLAVLIAWWSDQTRTIQLEDVIFITLGLLVLVIFVTMLGMHCGMIYADSRTAIGVSLGTVFFLFLGVMTCLLMMVSFSGSFENQLPPFLAFILGGGVGLYVSLGIRNPSPAIFLASVALPFATFYALISFLLGNNLAVFLAMAVTYGFATAAMMVPALAQFDFAMGRSTTAED
ncbi:MAG: ABC transporter permease subunit [Pirellulales bacterium]